jgi:hypothetical protein
MERGECTEDDHRWTARRRRGGHAACLALLFAVAARGGAGRGQAEGSKKSFLFPRRVANGWRSLGKLRAGTGRREQCKSHRFRFGLVVLGGREVPSARIQGRGEESQADESTSRDGTRECFTFTRAAFGERRE